MPTFDTLQSGQSGFLIWDNESHAFIARVGTFGDVWTNDLFAAEVFDVEQTNQICAAGGEWNDRPKRVALPVLVARTENIRFDVPQRTFRMTAGTLAQEWEVRDKLSYAAFVRGALTAIRDMLACAMTGADWGLQIRKLDFEDRGKAEILCRWCGKPCEIVRTTAGYKYTCVCGFVGEFVGYRSEANANR